VPLFVFAAIGVACADDHVPTPVPIVDASADHTTTDAAPDAPHDASEPTDAATSFDTGVDAVQDADGGGCNVRLAMPVVLPSPHVPDGTAVSYDSNPPSSGPHYPEWANFQEFASPVADGYLVHSLEHGAVLLLYNCNADGGGGACPDVVAALRAVRDAVPDDPLCDPSLRVRIVLAPRPANDVAVAAAAWGNTYRADCVDAPSLARFIADHYAQAPENFCTPGLTF
jgi:hypothetical protein